MKKSSFAAIISAVLLLTIVTIACKPKEVDDRPFAGTTITFMASQDWVQDAEIEILAPKFTAETGIKVEFQIIPSDQYPNLLMTRLNTGEITDIFGSQAGRFDIVTLLNVERHAVDLSGEAWVSRFDPVAALEVSVNGRVYGQPINDLSGVWAIAYNKKIFRDLNLNVPRTFAEFMAVCQTIRNAGITPIYQPVADGWHHVLWFPELGPIIEQREPGFTDRLNNNQTTLAQSPTARLIIDQIKEMVDRGFWGNYYMTNEYADAPRYFAEGRYAMFVANQGFPEEVNNFDPSFNKEDVGFFVMPLADNQILNVNPVGPTRFISSNSRNIEAAKMYFEFLVRPENLQVLINNVPRFNALPFSGAGTTYTASIQEFYNRYPVHGTVLQTAAKYINPQWMEIGSEMVNVILGVNDSRRMLENLDRNRRSQAQAAGDPAW